MTKRRNNREEDKGECNLRVDGRLASCNRFHGFRGRFYGSRFLWFRSSAFPLIATTPTIILPEAVALPAGRLPLVDDAGTRWLARNNLVVSISVALLATSLIAGKHRGKKT